MRGVVRSVLTRAAKSGLPGDHHFYISFETESPGVSLSKRLKEKYPRDMTIVLQHRFWDLAVTDDRFEVKLTFDGIPERLVVPFAAVKVFFDPSVRFGLQFDDPNAPEEAGAEPRSFDGMQPRGTTTRTSAARKATRPGRKPRSVEDAGEQASNSETHAVQRPAPPPPAVLPQRAETAATTATTTADAPAEPDGDDTAPAKPAASAEIVSLDKFRKK